MRQRGSAALVTLVVLLLGSAQASLAAKVTTDPNLTRAQDQKPLAASDMRLSQKITYHVQHRAVYLILQDLSELCEVELIAGANKNDWPVRDRKMNIFVKDTRLADLMNSMARVMKFKWTSSEDLKPPVYRLIVDRKAALAADAQMKRANELKEAIWQTRRDEWMDAIYTYGTKPDAELESLRQTNQVVYRYTRYGAVQALYALFEEVPEIKQRFDEGRGFRIASSKLSARTRQLVWTAGDNYWKYLQMSGQVGEATDDPPGYGDITADDKYDVAFVRMDEVGGFTPGMRWGGPGISAGYLHLMVGSGDREVADLRAINEEMGKIPCEWNNWFLDGRKAESEPGDMRARYTKVMEDEKKEEERLYPSEPENEHPHFKELDSTIKLKIDDPKPDPAPGTRDCAMTAKFQEALADLTPFGIVSDSWISVDGSRVKDQEAKLSEILEEFAKSYNYNWEMKSGILEFRHRKWWKNRLNQISDDQVKTWRENTAKNGFLSLEDLAKMSDLNFYQAEESLSTDEVLGRKGLYEQILSLLDRHIHWLRLYASLTPSLRTLLTEGRGVNGMMLTQEQWKRAQIMFDRVGASRGDALFRLETDATPDRITYRFYEVDSDTGEPDRSWSLTLPRYTPPPATKDDKKR